MSNWETFPEVPFRVKCSDANNGITEGSEYTVIRVEEDNGEKDFYLFYLEEVAEVGYFAYRFELVEKLGIPTLDEKSPYANFMEGNLVVNDQGGIGDTFGNLSVNFTFDSETFTKDFSVWLAGNISNLLQQFQEEVDFSSYIKMGRLK